MPHFIYILKLQSQYEDAAAWTSCTEKIVTDHFEYLSALAKKGVVKHFGRTEKPLDDPDLFGIVVLQVENEEAAADIMLDDPCICNEVMRAKLLLYRMIGIDKA
jgi:uncharacterized protein YciI